jgi:hypothetical protein
MQSSRLKRNFFHGDWNYEIQPALKENDALFTDKSVVRTRCRIPVRTILNYLELSQRADFVSDSQLTRGMASSVLRCGWFAD